MFRRESLCRKHPADQECTAARRGRGRKVSSSKHQVLRGGKCRVPVQRKKSMLIMQHLDTTAQQTLCNNLNFNALPLGDRLNVN